MLSFLQLRPRKLSFTIDERSREKIKESLVCYSDATEYEWIIIVIFIHYLLF